jgi:hypothetical protein
MLVGHVLRGTAGYTVPGRYVVVVSILHWCAYRYAEEFFGCSTTQFERVQGLREPTFFPPEVGFEDGGEAVEFAPHIVRIVGSDGCEQLLQPAQNIRDQAMIIAQFGEYRCQFRELGTECWEGRGVLAGVMTRQGRAEGRAVGPKSRRPHRIALEIAGELLAYVGEFGAKSLVYFGQLASESLYSVGRPGCVGHGSSFDRGIGEANRSEETGGE